MQSVQVKSGELTGMYYDYALAAPCMAGWTRCLAEYHDFKKRERRYGVPSSSSSDRSCITETS